ncbi:hypothetical protein NDU88_003978 [Pleurodeles waltl]|uniref:Uncharacterized protein n=1 Tax=Pleurodeles waltl TaxID=8319 RepID=A0AAV7V035_PLEWA|nr:hypothetical protein NDU88_003978 [Pleurodeles waltl]
MQHTPLPGGSRQERARGCELRSPRPQTGQGRKKAQWQCNPTTAVTRHPVQRQQKYKELVAEKRIRNKQGGSFLHGETVVREPLGKQLISAQNRELSKSETGRKSPNSENTMLNVQALCIIRLQ